MLSAPVSFDNVADNDINDFDVTKPDANCADNPDALTANVAGVPLINTWTPDAEILDDQAGNFVSDIEVTFDVTGYDKAPADTDAPATDAPATDAPATDAPTTGDSTKPNTNTGVEGVAAVAGVALLAAGAVVVAKKRK